MRGPRRRHSVPFVEGMPVDGVVQRNGGAQRARERLEADLDHVVRVGARQQPHVHRQPRVVGDGAEELLRELGLPAADRGLRDRALERAERPAAERRSRTWRAPRPSARSRRRSARCRCGRRAPGRAPGPTRCRRPRSCGAIRSRDRRTRPRRGRDRPCRASRSSMWSKKPTPVAAEHSPEPSSASRRRMLVSPVERSISAARGGVVVAISCPREAAWGVSARASADSAWTGNPSARATLETWGASVRAASAGNLTSACLRRKSPAPKGPEKRAAPPVGST